MTGTAVLAVPPIGTELVTMCCYCRRIQKTQGCWVEDTIPASQLVSHGICRDCFAVLYPDIPIPADVP
ncbi:MAG TPA: hypothetical protein VLM40_09380 [Gemmata sp.]|nr:hypothetical protein [Gemmata sp.]